MYVEMEQTGLFLSDWALSNYMHSDQCFNNAKACSINEKSYEWQKWIHFDGYILYILTDFW